MVIIKYFLPQESTLFTLDPAELVKLGEARYASQLSIKILSLGGVKLVEDGIVWIWDFGSGLTIQKWF